MVSQLEMLGFLKTNGTACRFVSLVADTLVDKIRKGNPFPGLRKVSKISGLLNANYNTSVRRRIAETLGVELKDVEYESGTTWYQHLTTTEGKPLPVVVNKRTPDNGKHYLQFFPHKSRYEYVTPGGEVIPEEQVQPWLYAKPERPDYKPVVVTIGLENVKQLKASGIIIEFPGFDEAEQLLAEQ
jgi:hypothetical protein